MLEIEQGTVTVFPGAESFDHWYLNAVEKVEMKILANGQVRLQISSRLSLLDDWLLGLRFVLWMNGNLELHQVSCFGRLNEAGTAFMVITRRLTPTRSPGEVVEPGVPEIILEAHAASRLFQTTVA